MNIYIISIKLTKTHGYMCIICITLAKTHIILITHTKTHEYVYYE